MGRAGELSARTLGAGAKINNDLNLLKTRRKVTPAEDFPRPCEGRPRSPLGTFSQVVWGGNSAPSTLKKKDPRGNSLGTIWAERGKLFWLGSPFPGGRARASLSDPPFPVCRATFLALLWSPWRRGARPTTGSLRRRGSALGDSRIPSLEGVVAEFVDHPRRRGLKRGAMACEQLKCAAPDLPASRAPSLQMQIEQARENTRTDLVLAPGVGVSEAARRGRRFERPLYSPIPGLRAASVSLPRSRVRGPPLPAPLKVFGLSFPAELGNSNSLCQDHEASFFFSWKL